MIYFGAFQKKKNTTDFLDEVLQFQLQMSTSVKTEEIQFNAKIRFTEAK